MTPKERSRLHQERLAAYKVEKGCVDCGYNKDSRALEFDHIHNSGEFKTGKQRTIASQVYSSWNKLLEEIEKCEVVCCNCHAIRTHERRNNNAPIVQQGGDDRLKICTV